MPQRHSIGGRVRQRRVDLQIKQADLAVAAGISPSYLNLIEHDRRRIGGKILNDIARALGIEPAQLSDGAESALVDRIRSAAVTRPDTGAELARAEEFAARFPGWAALLADRQEEIVTLSAQVSALTDRLAHDPNLATSLHAVISAVTSIRATSSILVNSEDIDRDWQNRFHRNLYEDSQRLADASRALTGFLEASADVGAASLSPADEAERFLAGLNFHIPALEGPTPALSPQEAAAGASGLRSRAAVSILTDHLRQYRADAVALPLPEFGLAAMALAYDPAALAGQFSVPLAQVLRRLACLPEGEGHPPIGLAICDGAGAIRLVKEAAGFALPRGGAACSLWPMFQALGEIGRPIRAEVDLPGDTQRRFLCYAIADARGPPVFDLPPVIVSVMLVLPDARLPAGTGPLRPVGPACRICPRPTCPARREPSILQEAVTP